MRKNKPYAMLIVFAAFLWSLGAFFRRKLFGIPPATIVFYEHLISVLLILPWSPRFFKEYKKLTKKDWLVMLLVGLVGGTLGTLFFTSALGMVNNISYSVVVLLQQTQPIFAVILAVIFLKERFNKEYVFLAIAALITAYFLAFPGYKQVILYNGQEVQAIFLALAAAAAWGSGTVFGRMMLGKLSFVALANLRFLIVLPSIFILSIILNQTYPITAISFTQWQQIIAIAIFGRIVAFIAFYKGLQYTEAKIATFAELADPVGAIIIGYFLLGERLTLIQWLSAATLMTIIIIMSLRSKKDLSK